MAQNFAERLGWIPKSEDLRMSMGRALNFAQERKHTEVTLEHFLLALIDDPNASAVFAASEINTERLRDEVEVYLNEELQHLAALGEGMAQPSESFKKVMAHASAAAEQSQREVIDGAIVLAALIGEGQSEAALILNNHGMTFDVVVNSLKNSNAAAQQQAQQHQRQEAPPQQRPEPAPQQPRYQETPQYQEPVRTTRQPESNPFDNDMNSGMSDQYAGTAAKEEVHHEQVEIDHASSEPEFGRPARENPHQGNPLNGTDQPVAEMRPAMNPEDKGPEDGYGQIPQTRPEPHVQTEADNSALNQSGPAPAKRNIFDQRAYVAPGGTQRPEGAQNNPAGGLQDAYPQSGSQTGSGNLAHKAETAEQPEKENISGEATVDDILASVREIIGVENSEQETIQPLGDQLNAENDKALQKSLDKSDDLKNEAFGQLKDVATSVAEEQAASMLDDVYPSEDAEETDENIDLDFPQPKPDLGETAKSVGKGLQDRLKEKSPFQSAEELAKNWPGTGKDKAGADEAEQEPQKPIVHENPFQPENRPENRSDRPNVPPHQQPPTRGQQPPPSAQAQEQKKGAMPPPQGQPLNQPPKQTAAPSGDKKAADQKGPAQQQPGPDAAQKGKPQQPGQQMPPPGQQPPPHRNMPPPPPGQQPGGNMPGQPPHHRPHPQQQPPQGYPGGKAGPGGPGGPMPVPPPPGAPMQGQRGAPPPHLAGQQPPQGRRPGGDPRGGDPRMEGRPPQGAEGQGQQRNVGTKGQLIENIPRIMRMGIPVQIEVRMARADVQEIERGMMGNNPPARHDVIVTEAMSVRLSAPKGGFNIAPASPETQWIDNRLGGDNYASWKWTITPLKSGKKALQLGISARLMGEKGVIAQSALPEQLVTVKVKVNYARTLRIFIGWLIIAAAGGVIGKYSERLVELIDMIPR